ncbi:MAG: hypothetical protein QNJ51_14560 [Calothrix sp. MO_167.B12]|nr:hypothetical protein [Calothrix sp. MO_167.B12]
MESNVGLRCHFTQPTKNCQVKEEGRRKKEEGRGFERNNHQRCLSSEVLSASSSRCLTKVSAFSQLINPSS